MTSVRPRGQSRGHHARSEELGMPLDKVIAEVIATLKSDAERLGLPGSSS